MESDVKQIILQELPGILQGDPEFRAFILRLSQDHFADKAETESRFDRILEELRQEREEQSRRWEEQQRRWEEQQRRWEEQQRRWEENQREIRRLLDQMEALRRRSDATLGALGARWGLFAEESFRSALEGILQDILGVQVVRVVEYDSEGEVFGHPDQMELDLIVKDGVLIIGEIKSSMSKGDMYLFERKARFYEKKHQQRASRLIVISPMVDKAARQVAQRLGIQVYSYAEDIDPAIFETKNESRR